jgi:hypothetical protein
MTLILAVVLVAPAGVLASTAPPRPGAGRWKVGGGGSFTVDHARTSIAHLSLYPSFGGHCGTAEIHIAGSQKLVEVSRAGYTNWVVGRFTRSPGAIQSGVAMVRVEVRQGGASRVGGLSMIFAIGGARLNNGGALAFGRCRMNFFFEK